MTLDGPIRTTVSVAWAATSARLVLLAANVVKVAVTMDYAAQASAIAITGGILTLTVTIAKMDFSVKTVNHVQLTVGMVLVPVGSTEPESVCAMRAGDLKEKCRALLVLTGTLGQLASYAPVSWRAR